MAVLVIIVISITLAIALPIAVPRARRAAEAAAKAAAPSAGSCPTAPTITRLDTSSMSLVFEDTFNTLNTSTWRHDLGDGSIYGLPGFGNGEMQASAWYHSLQETPMLLGLLLALVLWLLLHMLVHGIFLLK